MTKDQLTALFNKCIIVQNGNWATISFETEEEADAAFEYLAELGNMPPCQMGEHACADQSQCWEPCGALGHSMEHAILASCTGCSSTPCVCDAIIGPQR